MNKLESELQRLYFLPGQAWAGLQSPPTSPSPIFRLVTENGLARCLLISIAKGADWEYVAALHRGLQEDFELPAPAISVSVDEGYQVWLSLAEPVPLQLLEDFARDLCQRYLAEISTAKLKTRPAKESASKFAALVPLRHGDEERWSAFIDPTMGSMFVDETWLEMTPSLDRQAAILSAIESISAQDFHRVSLLVQAPPKPLAGCASISPHASNAESDSTPVALLNIAGHFADPRSFLLAVMNDQSASANHRIEAAVALLPFFENSASQ